ncbi:DNA-binding protein [Lysobacter sp. H21R4]|uniref:DNA-binding protein n=1 Tax=Lysobacter sp. H21R4 TaxID=2781021 RepID=UPI001888F0C9|nr:DNA-binding protein [Lysobacter sp. H21R4]QOY61874.1 DNA-binding protein [Lysobacter sp. H21R4]
MKRNLKSVTDFAAASPFSENQLRWYIFNERENGLADHGAIVRVCRRVYIDTEAFERWIDSQQAVAA